ncbi:hypothetical protein AB0L65_38465 [Nonomuraea sp. NPDC052116]
MRTFLAAALSATGPAATAERVGVRGGAAGYCPAGLRRRPS